MPYITQAKREEILWAGRPPADAGELNFLLTKTMLDYLEAKGTSYRVFNEIVGAVECAKMELYRRAICGYEDEKIKVNGDVYPYKL